jgi:hypothetical protein
MDELELPEPLYLWSPQIKAGLWKRALQMIAETLHVRAEYESPVPLTRWPHAEISFPDYDKWRSQGDRQRRAVGPRDPTITKEEAERRRRERERRSPKMREIHEQVCTVLICVALTGWELLVIKNNEGLHIALDIHDGVRCKIDRAGFVAENGSQPVLVTADGLTEYHRNLVRRLAIGEPPEYLNGLGHYGMGELLDTGANYLASWTYLQQPSSPDPRSPEGRAILKQRPPLALLSDSEAVKLAAPFHNAVQERRWEAQARQIHYQRERGTQPPTSRRYA